MRSKINCRVISDNGFCFTVVRSFKDAPFLIGQELQVEEMPRNYTAHEVYSKILDEDMQEEIFKKAEEGIRSVQEAKKESKKEKIPLKTFAKAK